MFERRPVWGILIGLTICISIWRISVQEPSMLAEYGYNNNVGGIGVQTAAFYQQQQLSGGKHLLARKINDVSDEGRQGRQQANTEKASSHERAQLNAIRKFKLRSTAASSLNQDVLTEISTITNSTKHSTRNNRNIYDSYSGKISGKRSLTPSKHTSSSSQTHQQSSNEHKHKKHSHQLDHRQHSIRSRNISAMHLNSVNATAATTSSNVESLVLAVTHATTITTISTSTEALQPNHQLSPNDFQQLIDLHNFDYIMPQPICADNIAALILVHTAPTNYHKRMLIRETWGERALLQGAPLRLIFLLGDVSNQTLQCKMQQENNMFADMVQGNFMDDYKNMTYKHVMAFKWFIYNCAKAQILIKVDDDVFVNTLQLLKYLQYSTDSPKVPDNGGGVSHAVPVMNNNSNGAFAPAEHLFHHPQHLLFCQQLLGSRVKRSYRSKWRVSVQEYANRYYPPYCPGYSIIYSRDVVLSLYNAAQSSKYFWIDDVHVTGTLAQLTNITITSSMPYVLSSAACERLIAGKSDMGELDFLFAWPGITEQQIHALWELNLVRSDDNTDSAAATTYIYDGFR